MSQESLISYAWQLGGLIATGVAGWYAMKQQVRDATAAAAAALTKADELARENDRLCDRVEELKTEVAVLRATFDLTATNLTQTLGRIEMMVRDQSRRLDDLAAAKGGA